MGPPRASWLSVAMVLGACGRSPLGLAIPADGGRDSAAATARPSCADLQPLADRGLLLPMRTNEVHFSQDRSHLILRVRPGASAVDAAPDRLVRVDLPSGKVTTITESVFRAEALGSGGDLLVRSVVDRADDIAVYDGQTLRHLASGLCSTRPSPDGRQVYVLARCKNSYTGSLEVIDVAVGGSRVLAADVVGGSVVNSPSGRFIAYLTLGASGDASTQVVSVLEPATGAGYTLASQPASRNPFFVSDELLIFTTGQATLSVLASGGIRGHRVGTGDTSYVIEAGHDAGPVGYQISQDKGYILTAQPQDGGASAWLYSTSLDGSEHRLLSTDLFPYWSTPMQMAPFAYDTQRRRAIFELVGSPWGVAAMGSESGPSMKIADHATFQPAPLSSNVVVFETMADGRERLRLYGIDQGSDRLSHVSDAHLRLARPLRGDRALLFVEATNAKRFHLRYLSSSYPDTVLLGEWHESRMEVERSPEAEPRGHYAVDPTECFTLVDTDLPPGPGTRLVLLPD